MSIVEHDVAAHRFTTRFEGYEAELDYRLDDGVMHITHTGVPPAIEGRGVAASLMRAALVAADQNGWTINPVCSYAATYLARQRKLPGG